MLFQPFKIVICSTEKDSRYKYLFQNLAHTTFRHPCLHVLQPGLCKSISIFIVIYFIIRSLENSLVIML